MGTYPRLFIRYALAIAMVQAGWAALASADTLVLDNGGVIQGRLDTVDGNNRTLSIETPSGARLTFSRLVVARIDRATEAETEYRSLSRSMADTIAGHRKLAEWCRQNRLRDEYKQHLERIVELDPNDKEARQRLGYRLVNGRWMTRVMLMAQRGMVPFEGDFRTRQHIELIKREQAIKLAEAEWSQQIERWRRWLEDSSASRRGKARQALLAIRDPHAANFLVELLEAETNYDVRLLLIQALGNVNSQSAVNALVTLALNDPDDEIRFQSVDSLIRTGRSGITTPFVRALKSPHNEIVNRAAAALQLIGDSSVMVPLIDALVTKHKERIAGSPPGQQAYTFSPDTGGFSFGGSSPQVLTKTRRNPAVRSALICLSGGANFDYDQQRWRTWLAAQKKQQQVDIRRDG